jgi:uncharacterized protein
LAADTRGRGRGGRVGPKSRRAALALQVLLALPLAAQTGVEALFPPRPAGFVTDAAGILDAASVQAMTGRIERLRGATGAEIAVVTLPTIGDRAAVDVAVAIGRAWGVGAQADIGDARRNAGVVVLLVPPQEGRPGTGHIFIATGEGVEGFVTDAAAGRVRDLMRPRLAAGEYGPGLVTGVEVLSALIAEGFGVSDSLLAEGARHLAVRRTGPPVAAVLGLILVLGIVVVVVSVLALRSASYAPRTPSRAGAKRRRPRGPDIFLGGGGFGGGFGGFGGGFGGGGFGGFGGGGGFSGGGAGGRF